MSTYKRKPRLIESNSIPSERNLSGKIYKNSDGTYDWYIKSRKYSENDYLSAKRDLIKVMCCVLADENEDPFEVYMESFSRPEKDAEPIL